MQRRYQSWFVVPAVVTLLVATAPGGAAYLASGENVQGTVVNGSVNKYRFSLQANQFFAIRASWENGDDFAVGWEWFGPDGGPFHNERRIDPGPGCVSLFRKAVAAGIHEARVTDYNGEFPGPDSGTYRLSFLRFPGPLNGSGDPQDTDSQWFTLPSRDEPLQLQCSVSNLSDLDIFPYKVDKPGGSITATMRTTSGDLAPTIVGYDPNGDAVARQWRTDPGEVTAGLTYDVAGTYWFLCMSYAGDTTGDYELTIGNSPPGPYVTQADPEQDGAVLPNASVMLHFSETMRMGNVNANLLFRRLADGADAAAGAAVPFTTSWSQQDEVVITPTAPLAVNARYRVTVPAGVRSSAGGRMASAYRLTFGTQGLLQDTFPKDERVDVSRWSRQTLYFRTAVDGPSVVSRFRLRDTTGANVALTYDPGYGDDVAMFRLVQPLKATETYTATLRKGVIYDGNATTWVETYSFTTWDRPVVTDWQPVGRCAPGAKITATFDRPMTRWQTRQQVSVYRADDLAPVTGTFRWSADSTQFTFTPDSPWALDTMYGVVIGENATDQDGNPLGYEKRWYFTPRATPPTSSAVALTAVAVPTRAGTTQVSVTLSAPASVEATVLNLAGRVVATLPPRELPAGTSTLLWNGRSATGTAVPSGRYLARIEARTAGGASAQCIVPLQR